jgi:HSP90 family molecular chaperone
LIDNSLDAKANRLDINLEQTKRVLPHMKGGWVSFNRKSFSYLQLHYNQALTLTDNGKGMNEEEFEKMLVGFGRTTKLTRRTIGQHGVGFKSGS